MSITSLTGRLHFNTLEFDAQLLRTLSKASLGGGDIGECYATAFQIEDGNFESWYQSWFSIASRLFKLAQQSQQSNHFISAKSAYLRACEYYRQASWFLRDKLDDPRISDCSEKIQTAFQHAIPYLPYHIEPVKIPFADKQSLLGYFCQPNQQKPAKATVIFPGGYDSCAEELFFPATEILQRNYNVLIFDGPGQGHTLWRHHIYMRPDWENVIAPVVDYVSQFPSVNLNRLIMLGRSLGGYLAPRAASGNVRFAALIADPGQWDLYATPQRIIPPDILTKIENKLDDLVIESFFKPLFEDKQKCFYFTWRMAVHGTQNPCEWVRMLKDYNLENYAKNIKCPSLICSAVGEDKSPGQAKILATTLGSTAELMLFTNEEGAGDHCEAGAPQLFAQRVYDWLDKIIL